LLLLLANISLGCSLAGVLIAFPAVVGVLLGSVTSYMAERDMERMGNGLLDPRGRPETHLASTRAVNALGLGIMAPLLCIGLWGICLPVLVHFL
jgi:hypothetical protein